MVSNLTYSLTLWVQCDTYGRAESSHDCHSDWVPERSAFNNFRIVKSGSYSNVQVAMVLEWWHLLSFCQDQMSFTVNLLCQRCTFPYNRNTAADAHHWLVQQPRYFIASILSLQCILAVIVQLFHLLPPSTFRRQTFWPLLGFRWYLITSPSWSHFLLLFEGFWSSPLVFKKKKRKNECN